MRRIAILTVSILTLSACAAQPQPANLGEAKISLRQYVASGTYDRDVDTLMKQAEAYIVAHANTPNAAIILDIDETSLSNWPQLDANDFSFYLPGPCNDLPKGPCGIDAWQKRQEAKAYPATLHLFETALAHNIAVFFITGRPERVRAVTEENLRRAGYHDWTKLVMRPAGLKTSSAADFKAPERRKIEEAGYNIIASIGDQPSDLTGGYADAVFLVPNSFYRIN